ncbi:hypothetical protein ABZX90_01820 [Streptomyces sp. NPDC002935]
MTRAPRRTSYGPDVIRTSGPYAFPRARARTAFRGVVTDARIGEWRVL